MNAVKFTSWKSTGLILVHITVVAFFTIQTNQQDDVYHNGHISCDVFMWSPGTHKVFDYRDPKIYTTSFLHKWKNDVKAVWTHCFGLLFHLLVQNRISSLWHFPLSEFLSNHLRTEGTWVWILANSTWWALGWVWGFDRCFLKVMMIKRLTVLSHHYLDFST